MVAPNRAHTASLCVPPSSHMRIANSPLPGKHTPQLKPSDAVTSAANPRRTWCPEGAARRPCQAAGAAAESMASAAAPAPCAVGSLLSAARSQLRSACIPCEERVARPQAGSAAAPAPRAGARACAQGWRRSRTATASCARTRAGPACSAGQLPRSPATGTSAGCPQTGGTPAPERPLRCFAVSDQHCRPWHMR